MALKAKNIYLTEQEEKVEGGFDLCNDDLLDSLISSVFLTDILLGLGRNEGL